MRTAFGGRVKKSSSNKFARNVRKYWGYYMLGFPMLLLLFIYRYVPMAGLLIAFKDFNIRKGIFDSAWVGFKWFDMLFSNKEFVQVIMNTIIISLMKLIMFFPVPIILALLLNELKNMYFKRTVQTVIYLPHFLSWAVLSGILFTIFSPSTGILKFFGITQPIFLSSNHFRWLLVLSEIWKDAGWGTIIYLAAITSIGPELYEAAIIDGASRLQRIWYITLPGIASTIIVLLILRLGSILDAGFDQVYMMYNPSVYSVADILDTYIFRVGLGTGRFSLATAAGLFKSIVGFLLVLGTNKLVKLYDKEAGIL